VYMCTYLCHVMFVKSGGIVGGGGTI